MNVLICIRYFCNCFELLDDHLFSNCRLYNLVFYFKLMINRNLKRCLNWQAVLRHLEQNRAPVQNFWTTFVSRGDFLHRTQEDAIIQFSTFENPRVMIFNQFYEILQLHPRNDTRAEPMNNHAWIEFRTLENPPSNDFIQFHQIL